MSDLQERRSRFQAQCLNCPWKGDIRETAQLAEIDANGHYCDATILDVTELPPQRARSSMSPEQETWIEQAKALAGKTIETVGIEVDGLGRLWSIVLKCSGQTIRIEAETHSHGGCWLEVETLPKPIRLENDEEMRKKERQRHADRQ